ncbi:MAG: ribosome small subunit-dependent GTPase A [Myxococcales bacterium]|nr:ribosome small subunit-dependent GTPase A [Myxococcales bacterium]
MATLAVVTVEEGIVLRATAGFIEVATSEGVVTCKLRGRLKKERQRTDLCVIGDRVRLSPGADGDLGTIEEVLPRETVLSRQHPAQAHREDVIIANLDRLFVVFAFGDPPFHPRMLDRFLAIAEHGGLEVVIVANKLDQVRPEQRALFDRYAALGYEVVHASALTGEGVDTLRERLLGKTSAFVGASGVGKSSLINAIDPALALRVGETSSHTTKGKHTTRVATLHPVAGGGYVADTPGIRELGAWALPLEVLDRCFVEMRPHLGQCAFRDCRHRAEPGCAVKAAVEAGSISPERYDSYLRLYEGEER